MIVWLHKEDVFEGKGNEAILQQFFEFKKSLGWQCELHHPTLVIWLWLVNYWLRLATWRNNWHTPNFVIGVVGETLKIRITKLLIMPIIIWPLQEIAIAISTGNILMPCFIVFMLSWVYMELLPWHNYIEISVLFLCSSWSYWVLRSPWEVNFIGMLAAFPSRPVLIMDW